MILKLGRNFSGQKLDAPLETNYALQVARLMRCFIKLAKNVFNANDQNRFKKRPAKRR